MSIKAIARDLYKAQQHVAKIEKELETAAISEQPDLQQRLRLARQELQMLTRIMAGEKETAEYRKKFQGFGK